VKGPFEEVAEKLKHASSDVEERRFHRPTSAPKAHKPTMKTLLQGVAQLLFIIAALCFFVGGRAISTFTKTERVLAEMEGIGLAVLCGALGFWAKTAADNLDEGNDASGQ